MRCLLIVVFVIPFICQSQIKVDRDRLYTLLNQGKTREVLSEAQRLRKEVYGKCAIIDYFIAKSLCLDRYYDKSVEGFRYILRRYPLLPDSRSFIEQEIKNCSRRVLSVRQVSQVDVMQISMPKAGVWGTIGKMGRVDCSRIPRLPDYSNLKGEDELESRLFDLEDSVHAIQKIQSLVGSRYDVIPSGPFILVFLKSQRISHPDAMKLGENIKTAYNFYLSRFNLRKPDKYITVYLMPDQLSLRTVAKLIHGIDLSNDPSEVVLGYSILADLSLIGMATPRTDGISSSGIATIFGGDVGNMYHELWHLLIRTDAGDISPWLDEGMASLYSTAKWSNGILFGAETWRTEDLRLRKYGQFDTTIYTPQLADLLSFNWIDFHGGIQRNLCQASVNYSLANHFLLYIQGRGLLRNVVGAIKERQSPATNKDSGSEVDVASIEKVFNESIQDVQKKFEDWFYKKYGFKLY